ncbi:MAG: hypothetical protein ACLQF1_05305 [Methyloceanibacter sp.]|jgi:hypothetical protein
MSSRRSDLALLLVVVASVSLALLPGCSTVVKVTGKEGASTDQAARYVKPEDPLARPIQVAWTSARATHCGFMFDPAKLRSDYLADETRRGVDPYQLQKLTEAYDYTLNSVMETISADPSYCNKERTEAIRTDLKRYLAGDYSPTARLAR